MNRPIRHLRHAALCVLALFLISLGSAFAEPRHRATHLGNPATRFADPLHTPDDLRRTLLKESLWRDVVSILRQSDYRGHLDDFRHAAAHAEIEQIEIPVGSVLPAMSTRRNGQPRLLRDVLWAGKAPIDAYVFSFISGERRYRVVTPKACSNFWVEEQLPRPVAALALSCAAPERALVGKPFTVCGTLGNTGELTEPRARLSLSVPDNARWTSASDEARIEAERKLVWTFEELAPGARVERCVNFAELPLGDWPFQAEVEATRSGVQRAACGVTVYGIPAVLLRVIDIGDPVMVGDDVRYQISVLNQGTTPLTQLRINARLEAAQAFVSGDGTTPLRVENDRIDSEPLPSLAPGQEVTWRITVKALQAADVRFSVTLRADQFARPIVEEEATYQY